MKKILAMILAAMMLLTLVACGGNTADDTTTEAPEENKTPVELPFKNVDELTEQLFAAVPEDSRPFGEGMGVDLTSEDQTWHLINLGLSEEYIAKLDGAYFFKGMNANNFSIGIYHFVNEADAAASADVIKKNVLAKEWECGFAEKVMVLTLPGNYVISMYGLGGLDPDPNFAVDMLTPFANAAKSLVDGVKVVVDEAIPF